MSADESNLNSNSLAPARLTRDLVRRYALRDNARALIAGSSPGEIVSSFRLGGVMAFGLFDGPAPPRDPYAKASEHDVIPELQPAVLHQSVPFLAQSFDCVVLRDSTAYAGSLRSPEACTATANLLASLKPGRSLVYAGPLATADFENHLSLFPGRSRTIVLGGGGIGGLLRGLFGLGKGQPAVQFTIPDEAISRLEWHRIARQAVMASQRPAA